MASPLELRRRILFAQIKNLWTDGDQTFTRFKRISVDLPEGQYKFSAIIEPDINNTASNFLVDFITANGTSADPNGGWTIESQQSVVFNCASPVKYVDLYAGPSYAESNQKNITWRSIKITRIGEVDSISEWINI